MWLLFALVVMATDSPTVTVTPAEPLLDEPVQIRLTGLPAGAAVTLRAEATIRGQPWRSHGTFTADGSGNVDVSRSAPAAGTYAGVDPMGLFWSMEPGDAPATRPAPLPVTEPRVTKLTAEIDGQPAATAEMKRWLAKPGVRVTDVREGGLVGRLFESDRPGRRPAILVLSGSEGGISENEAALLASHGYTAFALAYFNAEGLPRQLMNIPLEYLKNGIDWLRARESVAGGRLGVTGGSKGGELALLLASTFPEIKAVVASVPSHVVWTGIGGAFRQSSWTFRGEPLPCLATRPDPGFFAAFAGSKPVRLREMYESGFKDEAAERAATIPVEKIAGAVLLISGGQDGMWPSSPMADKVMARLKAHNHAHPFTHLGYEKAGHGIMNAYVPTRGAVVAGRFDLGGSPEANARAMADARPKVLKFWRDNLDGK